jgi:hypothetical protein
MAGLIRTNWRRFRYWSRMNADADRHYPNDKAPVPSATLVA